MNSPWDLLTDERSSSGLGGRFYGLYPAKVVDNQDPERQGRVKVALPWAPDAGSDRYEAWARVATLMAGGGRGTWFIPDQDDEVLVGFEAGDVRRPYVVGALWNGKDAPPESMDAKNAKKVIHSRNGVVITLDDTDGQETLELKTPGGQTVTLKDGPGSVEVKDSNGNSVKLEASGVTVTASAKVTVNASTAEISAGMLTVNAGMSKFSGVVQADTIITNSVVSASYTPGAGNVW
ncbi:phage baseplate assembly protein V [Corallococcus sicarius]|uniref:Type IV secretion protein Rhs n=1 Tax=Corallococcus sicarius TaxID=2316726 RepID=A0A3A8P5B6_9BACT|nr:phage baseplate assembly protein V [Corallococcus sicarius]RKH46954.1 type IV secretion protein Rhs [Corallococcus sicarius]